MNGDTELPWEDVDASRHDLSLQAEHPVGEARQNLLPNAKPCPSCGCSPERLTWNYFRSPSETWDTLCGCAGWLTICDPCHVQVDFFLEMIS